MNYRSMNKRMDPRLAYRVIKESLTSMPSPIAWECTIYMLKRIKKEPPLFDEALGVYSKLMGIDKRLAEIQLSARGGLIYLDERDGCCKLGTKEREDEVARAFALTTYRACKKLDACSLDELLLYLDHHGDDILNLIWQDVDTES